MNEIRLLSEPGELERAYVILRELRNGLSWQSFLELYETAHEKDQFTIVGLFEGGECLGVMGYRVLYDFVHGKHLYVDDLVVREQFRGRGLGAQLLKFAESEAERMGCLRMRLCTGVANEGARRFYEREGWEMKSVVFKR